MFSLRVCGRRDDTELKELMQSLGVEMVRMQMICRILWNSQQIAGLSQDHQDVLAVLLEMDEDRTGTVDFPNFKGWWQRKFAATLAIQQCPRENGQRFQRFVPSATTDEMPSAV